MTIYSFDEIKRHCKIDDCWIIIHNKVYDVSNYINNHPGGSNLILNKGGFDCTIDYKFHSKKAQKLITKFHIGYTDNYNYFQPCIIS